MKLGLQLNSFDWVGGPKTFASKLVEISHAAEEAGFDRIAVADHVWQHTIMGGPEANEPECYATLAFIAANTERVGLGAMGRERTLDLRRTGEECDHPGHALRGTRLARRRVGPLRGGGEEARNPVSSAEGAL